VIQAVSANTQAILLLTAPLLAQGGGTSPDLLPQDLYKGLARQLRALGAEPADLMAPDASSLIAACGGIVDGERLRRLLGRGFLLGQVVDRWQSRAIWVISRADPAYPRRLKQRLREDAPPILYGCGSMEGFDDGGLAVVGSRRADADRLAYAEAIGALAARSGYPILCGGADGIGRAATRGAIEAGGRAIGVLADGLEKSALLREHRQPLMDGRLVLVSASDPGARSDAGRALERNRLIYALADAALVVSADLGKGVTWAGATEQLDRLNYVPVHVRQAGEGSEALEALRQRGAIPWPEPRDAEAFAELFRERPSSDRF
jgi:predicted Rossmann fold nucleotide-binding protein DprA/Smf involved in DNA uptake